MRDTSKYVEVALRQLLDKIPEQLKEAEDKTQGFGKEKPRNYYRGLKDAYTYTLELIEYARKEVK